MLLQRVLTALVGAPIILASIWFGPPWLTLVAAIAAVIGVWEAYRLYPLTESQHQSTPPTALPLVLGATWAVALVLAAELARRPVHFGWAAAVICLVGCILAGLWMIAAWHGRRPIVAALYLVIPPVYIGGALACAAALRGVIQPFITTAEALPTSLSALPVDMDAEELAEFGAPLTTPTANAAGVWLLPNIVAEELATTIANLTSIGCWWLLMGVVTVYASDVTAYAVGRRWGRRQMVPVISPGKTWEGTIGGMVGAVAAVLVLGSLFPLRLEIWQLACIGVILGTVSPAGDLIESKLKRLADVKDSGSLFPGHGGMLDRLDSLLPSLTVVYILATVSVVTP